MIKTKIMAAIVVLAIFSGVATGWTNISAFASGDAKEKNPNATTVQDSVLLLGVKTIGPKDYIHLYDTTPYMIMNGHVAAKIPCDTKSNAAFQILIGKAPDLKPAEMEYISGLSTPGKSCLYHVDLASEHGEDVEGGIITDVAIYNPTSKPLKLGPTDSVFVGISEIMPLESDMESDH